jgi:hypothetical protein
VNASEAADQAITSKAKWGFLQGAYEYHLGKYEQFHARYGNQSDGGKRKQI